MELGRNEGLGTWVLACGAADVQSQPAQADAGAGRARMRELLRRLQRSQRMKSPAPQVGGPADLEPPAFTAAPPLAPNGR